MAIFRFGTGLLKPLKESKNFRSKIYEAVSKHDVDEAVESAINDIGEEINQFVQNKSGWIFHSNIKADINIFRYNPIKGSLFIPLPDIIANKNACINVQNDDDKCFLYSILAHKNLGMKHPQRQSKYTEEMKKEFESWNKYPMKYSDIGKFEKQFNLSINVYAYRLEKIKAKKVRGVSFAPRYITRNIIDNPENVISLLHMKQGEKSHFVLIKSLSALMYQVR